MLSVAEISVITSGVVGVAGGLGGPGLTAWFANRREERATTNARFDELRGVLDDASVALVGVWEAMPTLEQTKDPEVLAQRMDGARLALHKVWQQEGRIAARVGTSDRLYTTYHAAHDVAGEMYRYFKDLFDRGASAADPDRLKQIFVDMPTAQGAFFEQTAARIGPERQEKKASGG